MITIPINNGREMEISQDKARELIVIETKENGLTDMRYGISEGDFVMLMNYYRYIKDNDIQCDFINPYGVK